jgi:hypothetical protein
MDINVCMGEWMNSLMSRMISAADGDCFYLPTDMHLHAFFFFFYASFADKNFKVEVRPIDQA